MNKVGQFEFEWKTTIGKLICRIFGHTKKGIGGRCKRCLFLLKMEQE
jgi:hypothetical protein